MDRRYKISGGRIPRATLIQELKRAWKYTINVRGLDHKEEGSYDYYQYIFVIKPGLHMDINWLKLFSNSDFQPFRPSSHKATNVSHKAFRSFC
jgi:hypothetical protein